MEAAQLRATSDIDELEQIALQADIHGNTRSNRGGRGGRLGLFGWSASPNIERASPARERPVAVESPNPEKPAPVIHLHLFTAVDVTSYSELMAGIRQKLAALGIRYLDFDVLAGFAPGLSGKVFGPCEVKRLGPEKLFDAIRAAGLRIRLEEDPEQTAKMVERISENYVPRDASQARPNNRNYRPSEQLIDRVLTHLANNTNGGLALLNGAAKKARFNWARRAHQIRYGKG
jgi:hypothetical protein